MKKCPLFSVLIANYNNGKYIGETIESIINQTYSNWEIIIVDDASTDNSVEIVNGYIEKGINSRLYLNKINRGCGFTKRKCISLANGDLCGFLDSDDTITYHAIEKNVTKHLNYPYHSIVYSLNYICDERLNIINLTAWGGRLPDGDSQLSAPFGKKITAFASFKKSFYNQTKGINQDFKRAVDQDLYYKLEEVGKISFIEEPLYYYRTHPGNLSLNENNIKAWYWLYIANKHAFYRRKKNKLAIKNITYGQLQQTYLQVCLLKIDQKLRNKNFRNICYYYLQLLRLAIWDKELLIIKRHIFFLKRFLLQLIGK